MAETHRLLLVSFFTFGLMNNLIYVIILSAAADLVGPFVPKSVVLLADILPSLVTKMVVPYLKLQVNYRFRVILCVLLSFLGMQIVGWSNLIGLKLIGVILASFSSGLGEMTFLQLSTKYPHAVMGAFASGTGGAGLVGALAFLALTSWMGISVFISLMLLSTLPFCMGFAYLFVLPPPAKGERGAYSVIPSAEDEDVLPTTIDATIASMPLVEKLNLVKPLIIPYMLPLLLVYFAEYLINQGVAPTLLFPLDTTPFKAYRDFYVTYQTLYQLGVFISRSSISFYALPSSKPYLLYLPSLAQCGLLLLLYFQSLFYIFPTVWIIMLLILVEGGLGGLAYANVYWQIGIRAPDDETREFEMGVIGVADGIGILLAAFVGLWMEPALCRWQVSHDREWCRLT